MSGLSARTGQSIGAIEHIQQSLFKIITTPQGARVMREWFGNPGLRLLGETATRANILRWFTIIWALVDLFEPRFKIRRIIINSLDRKGMSDFTIEGEFRPYAHLDFVQAEAFVSIDDDAVVLKEAA